MPRCLSPRRHAGLRGHRAVWALVLAVPLLASGCDLFGGGVSSARIERVDVEALPFEEVWDTGGDGPDVYVDFYNSSDLRVRLTPTARSAVQGDVSADDAPLVFRFRQELRAELGDTIRFEVSDEDVVGDDLMFTTGYFTLAERYGGEEAGQSGPVVFTGDRARVVIEVVWE